MIKSAILASVAVLSSTNPMTDEVHHIARVESGRQHHLTVFCSAKTNRFVEIRFKSQASLYDRKGGLLIPFTMPVRFGSDKPVEMKVEFFNSNILLDESEFSRFIKAARSAPRIAIEFVDYRDRIIQAVYPLDGFAEALAAIEKSCGM